MTESVLQLHGIECAKCSQPAASHNFRTGQTIHLCRQIPHCQIHEARPHLSNGGDHHGIPVHPSP